MKVPTKITLLGDKKYAQYFIGAAQSQLRILENQISFQNLKQGIRRIRFNSRTTIEARICFNLREVKIYCLSAIRGIKKEYEKLPKLYVYVTISDYVTIWDLLTGEVAIDVFNEKGEQVVFPCHKDELAKWLKKIPNKPTRQILKDEPKNNRDYRIDNKLDIGNENRVELANLWDPSYNCYFGIINSPLFTNTVRAESLDTFNPYCCHVSGCEVTLDNVLLGNVLEEDTPSEGSLIKCTIEECEDSFSSIWNRELWYSCYMATYHAPFRRCRRCRRHRSYSNSAKNLSPFFSRTKHLYLGSYPSPVYKRPEDDGEVFGEIKYSYIDYSVAGILNFSSGQKKLKYNDKIEGAESGAIGIICTIGALSGGWENGDAKGRIFFKSVTGTFKQGEYINKISPVYLDNIAIVAGTLEHGSPYKNPVDIKYDSVLYDFTDGLDNYYEFFLNQKSQKGEAFSVRTLLGDIIIDCIPKREYNNERRLSEVIKTADFGYMCFSDFLREGISTASIEYEARPEVWGGVVGDGPEHATGDFSWCKSEARVQLDLRSSESNRTGISWCGSPYNYIDAPEEGKTGWYRVMLRFYMGGFHTGGRECLSRFGIDPYYGACPGQEKCDSYGDNCEITTWNNKLVERFSSVQPTIELEKPEKYPKLKENILDDDGEDTGNPKYERPNDYETNIAIEIENSDSPDNKGYSTLCAFPGRGRGSVERENEDGSVTCYPFDGTYVLHTLGAAVEELINNCYKDGSDDQLLVYLYERPNMIEKEVVK